MAKSVKQFIQQSMKKESFSDMVLRFMRESDLKHKIVYKRANMDRKLFSKLMSTPDYHPIKKTVCAIVLALRLDQPTSKQLVKRAGYILSSGSAFDLVIRYCIEHGIYDLHQVNILLMEAGSKEYL
jgi:hypothetical protein